MLAVGAALVAFIACQYWWERRKRRVFRNSLEDSPSKSAAQQVADAHATAASGGNLRGPGDTGAVNHQAAPFPPFRDYFLDHLGSYSLAVLFVSAALLIRLLLEPALKGRLPYGFFLLAVLATALVADIWETLLALVAGFLVAVWFFVEPPGFAIGGAGGWWGAVLYFLTGLGILWFMRSEHTAWFRALDRDIAYFDRLKELEGVKAALGQRTDREMLAGIVDGAQDAILSVTPQGRIATWNPAAQRLFGFSDREAVGQPLALIVPPEQGAKQQRLLEQITRGERTEEWQVECNRKNGPRIEMALTFSPVNDRSGKLTGASIIARDRLPKG
jgi:PAS domain S-box-containing protein